jgi:hypothetical protein
MHKDEASMLKAICERLKVGRVKINLPQCRYYSTKIPRSAKFDENADTHKIYILSENEGKSGIYL